MQAAGMASFTLDLERRRRAASPRYAPLPTPLRAVLIHGGITLLWVALFVRAFGGGGTFAWSIGFAYIGYDTALLLFVFLQTLPLRHPTQAAGGVTEEQHRSTGVGVIVAAHNEAAVLSVCLTALLGQTVPADEVVIADDGSDDATAELLSGTWGIEQPALGDMSEAGKHHPTLRWLRLPHGGKARALNEALGRLGSEVVLTVDADTVLDPEAVAAMRHAFAADPGLVAATGVLFPVCSPTRAGRWFQWFQTYEYMRNFLSRYAWARQDGLLLISGAFAAYRRRAVLAVGGFDTDCLVEDYELTHRLLDHAVARGLGWRTDVIGGARARTDAPDSLGSFLRQRRRWFGGFLQTQLWYRHMIGSRRYGRLGTRMLPVKAFDTMQPLYGLTSFGLLIGWGLRGHYDVVGPVACIIGGKIGLDLLFYLWSLLLYRRWAGPSTRVNLVSVVVAALIEPFSFQVLRHSGAALGWVSFLTRERGWGLRKRGGLMTATERLQTGDR
jgi:cellulose synthase/poly-beta-1,6-N-acetylglucosamine synthase-like glycosyltransferase